MCCQYEFRHGHDTVSRAGRPRSFPGEYWLLEVGNAGVAAGEQLAELVDQRRRRRVNELAGMAVSDDAALALRDRHEIERFRPRDLGQRDAMYRGDLVRIGQEAAAVLCPRQNRRDEVADRVG